MIPTFEEFAEQKGVVLEPTTAPHVALVNAVDEIFPLLRQAIFAKYAIGFDQNALMEATIKLQIALNKVKP